MLLEAPSRSLGLSPPAASQVTRLQQPDLSPWNVIAQAEMQPGPLWVAWRCAGTLVTEDWVQLLQCRHLMSF